MTIWGALAGGFTGTLALTTMLRAASEIGWTRIDLPFLLGTAFTADRAWAKVVGYGAHFVFGFLFALVYLALFAVLGGSGWVIGGLFGLAHGIFSATALVNVGLPAVHPRMGSPFTAADSTPLLESPGFLMLNYGRSTPLVTLVAHFIYGALVGGFVRVS